MALITKPDMEFIWASGGAVVKPSDVKIQTGWTPEVPPHQWENWIQKRQDEYLAHINQRGIPEWDGNSEYEAAGLSYVQGSNGAVYKSVAASGPATTVQDPTTDVTDTYWTVAFASTTQASETVQGIVELATTAEAQAGTDDIRAMTALKVKQAIDQFSNNSLPLGYFYGFGLVNNVAAPNTTVDVSAGSARNSTNTVDITLVSTLSGILQASGVWTAGNNQNKLDTGARANSTWYHVFAIRKTSDGSGDILFSTSATTPTMPSGYAGFRRIGAVRTDGSGNIIGFINSGNIFTFQTPIRDAYVTGAGTTPNATITVSTPLGVVTKGRFNVGGAANGTWVFLRPVGSAAITIPVTGPASASYIAGMGTATNDTIEYVAHETNVVTDNSSQVVFQGTATTSMTYAVTTLGYEEIR
ncbi:tail fiber assembly protein U' [Pseudomonas phage vB_PsaM_M1]|nr:tail fiber assembly protein U' [Pseudomonas phage vB_PsaM_M1]